METGEDTLLWLKSVAKKHALLEKLSYKNASLWWFNEFPLSLLVTDTLRNRSQRSLYEIVREYVYRLPFLVILYFLAKAIAVFILDNVLLRSKSIKSGDVAEIMAVSYTGLWRPQPSIEPGGMTRNQDVILGDIINKLRNNGSSVTALYTDSSLFIDFKTMMGKNSIEKALWKPVEHYLTLGIIRTAFEASRRYRKEWNKLKNNQEFIDSLDHNGMPLFNSLKDYLKAVFQQHTFEQVLLIELMARAIQLEKPDLIFLAGENLSLGKAAVIAAKLNEIPTLAIQHGNINPNYPEYLHTKGEVSSEVAPEYCPLTDKIAVYGPQVKEFLARDCSYPEDTVVVTGQPRYDVLARANEIFSREQFCKRYDLNPSKKVALICTENLPIFEENTVFLRAILKSLRELPEVQVVIKPHHAERGKWYERIAREEKVHPIVLPKKFNTYLAMYACEVMLAFFSTTITEALILDKPVVVVNLTGKPDPMPYVESGVAIGAYKQEDIAPAIEAALDSKNIGHKLAQARKDFIYQHAYIQDGLATERVTELVEQMLGGNQ